MTARPLYLAALAALLVSCGGEGPQGTAFTPGTDVGMEAGEPDVCSEGCEDTPDLPEEGCSDDGACLEGEICLERLCQPGCRSDAGCGGGFLCLDLSCVEGCRDPSDCDPGFTCVAGQCEAEPCANDEECGSGALCVEESCVEIGGAQCASDEECGFRWRCSPVTGVCIDSLCALDGDCPSDAWCRDGLCEPRSALLGPVSLERRVVPGLSDHLWTHREEDASTYGSGGGLFDMDGDLDLDLFLGAFVDGTEDRPCVYENVSEPGELRFEPVEGFCDRAMGNVSSAWGIDLEGEGRESLLLLGRRLVHLVRPGTDAEAIDLLDLLPEGDYRRLCTAGTALVQDLDYDGLLDLLIGCQLPTGIVDQLRQEDFPNIVFRQVAPGQFFPEDNPLQEMLADRGNTLAFGALDIDRDGLSDILIANDIWLGDLTDPDRRLTPGGPMRRCAPDEACVLEVLSFGRRSRAFGAFMGMGRIEASGRGEHLYVTDAGSNRFVSYDDELQPVDIASELGLGVSFDDRTLLFAWSVVVDDFDRNGLDDFLFTQGPVAGAGPEDFEKHFDALFLQRAGGDFTMVRDEAGLTPHTMEDARSEEKVFSSRGAVKADLDGDGTMEIIIAGLEGSPLIYSEVPQGDDPPRCTLVPRPRVVPSQGWGYAVAPVEGDDWRGRDIQGQMRFGASPWVLTTLSEGRLRFPSGAVLPFDCAGTAGPVEVIEPDWVQLSREGQVVLISLDAPWLPPQARVEVALPPERGEVSNLVLAQRQGQFWRVPVPEGIDTFMLKVDGQWIARWMTF